MQSYLSNRKQFGSIDGYDSVLRDLSCGVPQGSSLGPSLFLVYTNDFRLCLQKSESGHFSDDTYILFGSNKLGTIESVVNYATISKCVHIQFATITKCVLIQF